MLLSNNNFMHNTYTKHMLQKRKMQKEYREDKQIDKVGIEIDKLDQDDTNHIYSFTEYEKKGIYIEENRKLMKFFQTFL